MSNDNTDIMNKNLQHYCPGCGHRIIHRLLADAINELGIRERIVLLAPVGCAVLLYNYFDCDIVECAHGRAPAVATGIKRFRPETIVISYQGDGDLASIGMAETIHTANRGENITVIFVNNAVYGMTGGQYAPTSLPDQVTTTTPYGDCYKNYGMPIRVCELLKDFDKVKYLERCAVNSSENVKATKEAIMTALRNQIDGKGYSLVEVISMCPVGWRMNAIEACKYIDNKMIAFFPLGRVK